MPSSLQDMRGVLYIYWEETTMFNVSEDINMYDMFTNREVLADSPVYCYRNYVYLYSMEDFFIFLGV